MSSPTVNDRLSGGLWGLLVGDAVGVPYEFKDPLFLPPRDEIELTPPQGFYRSHSAVPPGTWSDDGAHALALLASLLEIGTLDVDDFGRRLVAWFDDGYMAVGNDVFDVGNLTRAAIGRLKAGRPARQAGSSGEYANGNGSLMRVLPLALWLEEPMKNSCAMLIFSRSSLTAICVRKSAAHSIVSGRDDCCTMHRTPTATPSRHCEPSMETAQTH